MANEVYANMMEVSCKAADGKSICAFPDVCFTPPLTPATPPGVPLPYPNTGLGSDTSDGSKTVTVSGQETMLKNKSCFKSSTGDEAGCAPKKGLISSKIKGKVYFTVWSMDVKFEGENVVRNLDLTTHNHAAKMPGNESIPWPHVDGMAPPALDPEHEIKCAIKKCDTDPSHQIHTKEDKTPMPASARCSVLGTKKHKCVSDALKAKGVNCKSEQTFDMRKPPPPKPCGASPGKGLGKRPDIVVPPPPSASYDVYDAKFPCSAATKNPAGPSSGSMPSAPVTAAPKYTNPTSKEMTDYKMIANGGKVKVLTPEDCKGEKCE
jgi:hypothetical protein